jgi:hypothetical protein
MKSTWDNVQWYKDLLLDKKTDKMDLNYWLDYVMQFGVEHKIPAYDNMSFVKYYNLDLLAFTVLLMWGFLSGV